MKTAKELYQQLRTGDKTGLDFSDSYGNTYMTGAGYYEIETGRYIDITIYYDEPAENTLEIFRDYGHAEKYILSDFKRHKPLEVFKNNNENQNR